MSSSPLVWIAVALISGTGAVLRFALGTVVQSWARSDFPFGTLAVNVLGAFALGVLHGAGVTGDALLLTGTALLGSFTTFSSWMLESERLSEHDMRGFAVANALGGLAVLGLAAVALGWALAAGLSGAGSAAGGLSQRAVEVVGRRDQPEVRERLREIAECVAVWRQSPRSRGRGGWRSRASSRIRAAPPSSRPARVRHST